MTLDIFPESISDNPAVLLAIIQEALMSCAIDGNPVAAKDVLDEMYKRGAIDTAVYTLSCMLLKEGAKNEEPGQSPEASG